MVALHARIMASLMFNLRLDRGPMVMIVVTLETCR